MLELLQFVFSGFWTFFGCLVLVGAVMRGIAEIIVAFRQ